MRLSAQNLPSVVSIQNRDSQGGGYDNRGSQYGNDSMLSLFQQINQKVAGGGQSAYALRAKEIGSRRSQSSLSGVSKDFAEMLMRDRVSLSHSELEFNADEQKPKQNIGVKNLLRKKDVRSHVKGNALGFGATMPHLQSQEFALQADSATGYLENIKEENYNSGLGPATPDNAATIQTDKNVVVMTLTSPKNPGAKNPRSGKQSSGVPSSRRPGRPGGNSKKVASSPGSYESEYDSEYESEEDSEEEESSQPTM